MAIQSDHPYAQHGFVVQLSSGASAGFSEVSGIDVRIDVIEYREGSDVGGVRKLDGLARYSNVVLRRGVTGDLEMWQWIESAITGRPVRQNVTIALLNDDREVVVQWRLRNAWPARYTGPLLRAAGSDVAIETLELAHEGFDVE
jgi:phage tail-like protein